MTGIPFEEAIFVNKSGQTFVNLNPGVYFFELWGAQGGTGSKDTSKAPAGGKGSFVSGLLDLKRKRTFYLFIGGKGEDGSQTTNSVAKGGFNGGGNGGADTNDNDGSGAGGGSTDVRLINGTFNDSLSIYSRIIVAAGGSGSAYNAYGSPGGDIHGYLMNGESINNAVESSTDQEHGYKLGIGEDGKPNSYTPSSGAGAGYYGGYSVEGGSSFERNRVSSSGSSFISGFTSCDAVDNKGEHLHSPVHYSKLVFTKAEMFNGMQIFQSPKGGNEIGHEGDGAIRITLVKEYVIISNRCRFSHPGRAHIFVFLVYVSS